MFICASFPSHTILQVYDELPIVLPLPITSQFSVFQIPIIGISMYIIHIHIGIIWYNIYIHTFRYYLKVYGIYWSTFINLDTILSLCIYIYLIHPQFKRYMMILMWCPSTPQSTPLRICACSMYLPSVSIKEWPQARSSWRIRMMCSPWSHRPGLMDNYGNEWTV